MEKLLTGTSALVTGAGENIGRSIALELAKQGANVFFTEIDEAQLTRLQRELNAYDVQSQGFASDIRSTDDIDTLCASLADDDVHIDLLVHNAALDVEAGETGIENLDIWRDTFDTNVFGPVYLTKKITASMIRRKTPGSILFISSIHQWTRRQRPNYSASKAAIGMLVKELAIELAPHEIRVNGIAPGGVRAEMNGQPHPNPKIPLHEQAIPPRYIGRAAVYLAANYFSKFTTGTVLKIDSGASLLNYLDLYDL